MKICLPHQVRQAKLREEGFEHGGQEVIASFRVLPPAKSRVAQCRRWHEVSYDLFHHLASSTRLCSAKERPRSGSRATLLCVRVKHLRIGEIVFDLSSGPREFAKRLSRRVNRNIAVKNSYTDQVGLCFPDPVEMFARLVDLIADIVDKGTFENVGRGMI